MRRRQFIAGLGSAAAWPIVARGQQSGMPTIGYLHGASPEPYAPMIAAFRQGLKETGYLEGKNVAIEFRWAENRFDLLPSLAAELVRRQVAVIVVGGGDVPTQAAKRATATIPIVFVSSNPVETGLVASLNRPGGNLTGVDLFTITLGPKRLELLRELVPNAGNIAMLTNPFNSDPTSRAIEEAARAVGQPIHLLNARSEEEIDAAFTALGQTHAGALLIGTNPFFINRLRQIVDLANHYRIPTVYPLREYVTAGGLISYGASITNSYRQTGVYAGRILNGAKPNDMPVEQPTKFELVINLKTAKALGLDVPQTLLARADEVIE
jgi:putative ABC transport system substrate-binding protein